MPSVHFRVSSGLKSIIGRELITDDFIAVFELVKNAFDAYAKRVDITFDLSDAERARIIIRDNGKGMNRDDLLKKWLFVAYSAKKEGTEDYRERIRSPRIYAGAKGIGRFSCDKLGRHLRLLTRRKNSGPLYCLSVDWEQFEVDAQREFIDIPAVLTTERAVPREFRRGTILEISGLREEWNREKLLKLRQSLQKLINPNQGNDARTFSIFLHCEEEVAHDKALSKTEPWNTVNGRITNFLFEELKIKSTYIHVHLPDDGTDIVTRLEDRGRFIYEIAEHNDTELHGIDIHLFALNQSAKITFTRKMGIPAVQFGSVFLFKNGFRVYPFGEVGEDSWGIDRRKQQGQARFLGTRDLIGRVEISGDNPGFQEASSRDGGLIQNPEVARLEELFKEYALKRLERFAVDVIKYGNQDNIPSGEFHAKSLELILQLTKSKGLRRVDYDPSLLDIVNEASEKSLNSLIAQFSELAESSPNQQIARDIRRAEKRIRELERARGEAETESAMAESERERAERDAERERERAERAEKVARKASKKSARYASQNLFLQSLVSADTANLVGLHHHIGIAAGTIQNYVQSVAKRIRSGKPMSADLFLESLEKIALQANQIASCTRFATKANFSMDAALIKNDLVGFVKEYLLNVCNGVVFTSTGRPMEISWSENVDVELIRTFRPLEVVVLVDNLINNSRKAGATRVVVSAAMSDNVCTIRFQDNGSGITPSIAERAFELGFTTTQGSGFGLFHARQIAEHLGGSLTINLQYHNGAELVLEIPK